ncbi:MAG TPA: RNA-binding cell elongation regulator Jag/EloR [Candidatus Binataceae bacterium]|nr:RNA-binding cell elongation regulator Jag/EloR [Candidatus Binataceae bacterium]
MTANQFVEVEGATVEEAIRQALDQLGAGEDDVVIEVLSTPRAGLLGLGARRARVRLTRRAANPARSAVASPRPAPPPRATPPSRPAPESRPTPSRTAAPLPPASSASPPAPKAAAEVKAAPQTRGSGPEPAQQPAIPPANLEEQAREAQHLLRSVLDLMGEQAEIVLTDKDAEGIALEIQSEGSGILIGRHGQTLDALEYLMNRLMARRVAEPVVPIILDIAAYRARRRQQLERMALTMGERAKREHQTVALEPMPPRDRRIIHLTLKDDPLITTRSVGSGYARMVEVVPTDLEHASSERTPRRSRPSPAEPLGEQGGFKGGQKRII